VTEGFYDDRSISCHYKQHAQCADSKGICKCPCHVNHCCLDCGRILGQGQPWQRCGPCWARHDMIVAFENRQSHIETVLAEPLLIEAKDTHRRILTLIGES
jgi:hypothetical protein